LRVSEEFFVPCEDITDSLKIHLDKSERVVDYSLKRRTCGRGVGQERLIADWLFGRTASEVLQVTPGEFQQETKTGAGIRHYLALKHFMAVQNALSIVLGRVSGGPDDSCTLDCIDYSQDGIEIRAHLGAMAKAEEIEPCRSCCGSK
jgi:hypothetical protein